jgi:hypothetical protein
VMAMMPPHMQVQVEVLVSAGRPPTSTVGEPGAHGVVTAGIHGCGVNTPSAAAVAAMTCGFAGLIHIAKGIMLTCGTESMTVATGCAAAVTPVVGATTSAEGAAPKAHCNIAPLTASIPAMRVRLRRCGAPQE